MIRVMRLVLTTMAPLRIGLPTSNQVPAPMGNTARASRAANFITSAASASEAGEATSVRASGILPPDVPIRLEGESLSTFFDPTMRVSCCAIRSSLSLVATRACMAALLPPCCAVGIAGSEAGLSSPGAERLCPSCFVILEIVELPAAKDATATASTVAIARASPHPRGVGIILPGLQRPEGSKATRTCSIAVMSSSEKISGR